MCIKGLGDERNLNVSLWDQDMMKIRIFWFTFPFPLLRSLFLARLSPSSVLFFLRTPIPPPLSALAFLLFLRRLQLHRSTLIMLLHQVLSPSSQPSSTNTTDVDSPSPFHQHISLLPPKQARPSILLRCFPPLHPRHHPNTSSCRVNSPTFPSYVDFSSVPLRVQPTRSQPNSHGTSSSKRGLCWLFSAQSKLPLALPFQSLSPISTSPSP